MIPCPRVIKRWWRSRGHGVHSPFAFRFIRNVLCDNGDYYSYSLIDGLHDDSAWLKLLFRLVCEFEPAVVEASGLSANERAVISLADSRVSVDESGQSVPGCLTLVGHDGMRVTVVRDIHAGAGTWSNVVDSMVSGMTFSNGRVGVAVPRADLPRQDFDVRF